MRISDWSSDVCSSDLVGVVHVRHQVADLLDVLDAVEALQQVDHRADGVVAAGQADAEQGHLRSLRVWGAGRLVGKKLNARAGSVRVRRLPVARAWGWSCCTGRVGRRGACISRRGVCYATRTPRRTDRKSVG